MFPEQKSCSCCCLDSADTEGCLQVQGELLILRHDLRTEGNTCCPADQLRTELEQQAARTHGAGAVLCRLTPNPQLPHHARGASGFQRQP